MIYLYQQMEVSVYQLYENLGIRAVWKALLSKIKGLFTSNKDKKLAQVVNMLSVDDLVNLLEAKRKQEK